MTDIITNHTEKEIDRAKAQQDLEIVEYTPPILLPTKDVEIVAKITEIKTHQDAHARGEDYIKTREQYVQIVGTLKEELIILKQENETILEENRNRTEQASADYQALRTPKEVLLKDKEDTLGTFVKEVNIPLEIPELPTYAQVEDFNTAIEKPLKVKRTFAGTVHHVWCYVTEDIKNLYLAGNLVVGDVVIVNFVDRDLNKPIVLQKVYKSW